jgi:hypothetical protein
MWDVLVHALCVQRPGPSNGRGYTEQDTRYSLPRKASGPPPPRLDVPRSPRAPLGPSRLAIANEQAAATGGFDEEAPAPGTGDQEVPAASPPAKSGGCAIM